MAGLWQRRREFEHRHDKPVRIFRIKRAQKGAAQAFKKTNHAANSGNARLPLISSGNGFAHSTACIGSSP